MKPRMREELRGLLREVVEKHCPEYLSNVDRGDKLTGPEKLAIQQAAADELVATGLRDDDEPNERGLRLESLIDFLGRE